MHAARRSGSGLRSSGWGGGDEDVDVAVQPKVHRMSDLAIKLQRLL